MKFSRQKTFPELAQEALTDKEPAQFIESLKPTAINNELEIVIFYFQALSSILGRLYTKRELQTQFPVEKIEVFKNNKATLETILELIEELDLPELLLNYNEAVIISGLVYSLRQYEASIKHYNKFKALKRKFLSWPTLGIQSIRVIEAWKHFAVSIIEVEQWLDDKKKLYLKPVEAMVNLFEKNSEIIDSEQFFHVMSQYLSNDKEMFYGIANILISNPLLYEEIHHLSQMDEQTFLQFEQLVFGVLRYLNQESNDKMLSNMIELFTKQIRYERPEIIN